jgi:hypothetical protein
MQVIEAQCTSILEPHDHLHIKQKRTFNPSAPVYKYTVLPVCSPVVNRTAVRADGAKQS